MTVSPVEGFLDAIRAGLRNVAKLTPREHAAAAYRVGGPSIDDLERRVVEFRSAGPQTLAVAA